MTVLRDPARWRQLVAEYAALDHLANGMTRQARGQRFNGLIAELLRVFGVDAKANQLSVGELDVTFRHGGRPFILEAKWEQRRTSTGPIAKLQRRIEQRMVGVVGVFLSMEGFSDDGLNEVDKGRRLDMVLLDRSHWEAMLSGFVPPPELFDLVTDAASFRGQPYVPLHTLLDQRATVPVATFGAPRELRLTLEPHVADQVKPDIVVSGIPSAQRGVALDHAGKLLLTVDHGILAVDLARRRTSWAAPVMGCSGSPLSLPDGALLVGRAYGVGRYHEGRVTAVSSGAARPDSTQLLDCPDGSTWCFDSGAAPARSATPTLIKLGARVGDEQFTKVHDAPADAGSAVWLTASTFAMAGADKVLVLSDKRPVGRKVALPAASTACLASIDDQRVLAVANSLHLHVIDVESGGHTLLGRLDGPYTAACRVARGRDGSIYLAVSYLDEHVGEAVGVAQLQALARWTTRRAQAVASRTPRAEAAAAPESPPTPPATPTRNRNPAKGIAPVSAPATPVSPGVPVSPRALTHVAAESRVADQRRGYGDGVAVAATLPLQAFEGLIAADFDLIKWLDPWREGWQRIVSQQAPEGAVHASWLPTIARYLGSYAAPSGLLEAHFTPTPPYAIGFRDGLRAAWDSAVRGGLVPYSSQVLGEWLKEPVSGSGPPRYLATIPELQSAAARARNRSIWAWIGRATLWLFTAFFGVGVLAAIGVTATDGWPEHTWWNTLLGNVCYDVPFALLLWLTIFDLRRLLRRRRSAAPSSKPTDEGG